MKGVDDWDRQKWESELAKSQVLVMIHQVLLDALSRGYIRIPNLALIIIDECHHAVKNHCYSKIMRDWYHKAKEDLEELPKILGLSASIVVKSVNEDEFKAEKAKLEAVLDAEVETCDELSVEKFVSFAETKLLKYPANMSSCKTETVTQRIQSIARETKMELLKIKTVKVQQVLHFIPNKNNQATALECLKKDHKFYSNTIIGSAEALVDLGLYSLFVMRDCLQEELDTKSSRSDFYDVGVKEELEVVTRNGLGRMLDVVSKELRGLRESETEKIRKYSCSKLLKLFEIIEMKGFGSLRAEMRCIIFVERKLTARALVFLIWRMGLTSVKDVGFIHSTSAGRSVKDPRDREDVSLETRKMSETLQKFREGRINVLVSTSVVEEGIDVPSCNLVIKFDFPQTFRSFVQSRGRARQKGSR